MLPFPKRASCQSLLGRVVLCNVKFSCATVTKPLKEAVATLHEYSQVCGNLVHWSSHNIGMC